MCRLLVAVASILLLLLHQHLAAASLLPPPSGVVCMEIVTSTAAVCVDVEDFEDAQGYGCDSNIGYDDCVRYVKGDAPPRPPPHLPLRTNTLTPPRPPPSSFPPLPHTSAPAPAYLATTCNGATVPPR